MNPRLYLFDTTAFLHRAMHGCYGSRVPVMPADNSTFVRQAATMIAGVIARQKIDQLVLVADSTEPSFRCDVYPDYKKGRSAHPPVFKAQVPRFYEALEREGVKILHRARYEADDLIATIALDPWRTTPLTIVSSDKDLTQLLDHSVEIYDAAKARTITAEILLQELGLSPLNVPDYLGLVGDTSDNIPGVSGIGPKKAIALLQRFGVLEALYHEDAREPLADMLGPKTLQKLLDAKANAFLSRQLALPCTCPELDGFCDGSYPASTKQLQNVAATL